MVRATTAVPRTDRMTIVGVFHNQREAQEALRDLRAAGFREDEIGLIAHDEDGMIETHDEEGNKAGEGAAIGAATGAGAGALWAVAIAAGILPAIGPVIAGGILGSVLASAAGGAAAGGLAGALIGLGIPDEEAEYYENEFRSGRTLVTVKTSSRREEAWRIWSATTPTTSKRKEPRRIVRPRQASATWNCGRKSFERRKRRNARARWTFTRML